MLISHIKKKSKIFKVNEHFCYERSFYYALRQTLGVAAFTSGGYRVHASSA
jgi:hypothetical protein